MNLIKIIQGNKIVKETSWSFIAKGTAFILYFIFNIYLARTLGAEKYGTWSFFFSILTIILLLSYFGIDSSRKYVAQFNNEAGLKNILQSSIKLRLIFSLSFSLVLILFHAPLAGFIGRPEFATLFLLATPMIILAGFIEFLKQIYIGLHRIKYNFIVNLIEYGLKLIFVVILLKSTSDLSVIINSFNGAYLLTLPIGFYILYVVFYRKSTYYGSQDFTKEILKYGIPLFFISIGFLIATEVDTVMLGFLATDSEVGTYAVAKQIIIKLPHISLAIVMGSMPVFAKLNRDNKEELKRLFYKLIKINAAVMTILTLGIIFLSAYFIPLIFGIEYIPSILPLQILTVYLVIFSFSIFLSTFLDYQGLAKKRAVNLSISITLNIVLNLILIPIYGAIGAAIATSISYFPYIFLNWVEVRKFLR